MFALFVEGVFGEDSLGLGREVVQEAGGFAGGGGLGQGLGNMGFGGCVGVCS